MKTAKPNKEQLRKLLARVAPTQWGVADELKNASGRHVSQQVVQNWLRRGQVPANWVPIVVQASKGTIEPYELRPDVFARP